jgi:hypothetical protein
MALVIRLLTTRQSFSLSARTVTERVCNTMLCCFAGALQIEKVKEMLLEEKEKKGLLITDHLFHEVIAISDRLYILTGGRTHLAKTVQDIETFGYAPGTELRN